jgi:hypothetical protein
MYKLSNENEEAIFLTVDMASKITSLGRNTVRRMAQECNAVRKIGKSVRINRKILLDYIDTFEA